MSYYQEGYDFYDHSKGVVEALAMCPYRKHTYAREAWMDGVRDHYLQASCMG